ncbi:MAG: YciI family protein [Isosphaeraceae bacterium]
MKVMVIVKATQDSEAGIMPSTELLTAMGKFNEDLVNAGVLLAGEGLHPSSKGARVRFSGKNRAVTDGPFTETKELIAGFWLWRVNSLQEAIEWVKKCPNPMREDSDIEIRPVFEPDDWGPQLTPELRQNHAELLANSLGLGSLQIRDCPGMLIAGLNQSYTLESRSAIPQQWERFVSADYTVTDRVGADHYGIAWNTRPDCGFDYLTGTEVSRADRLPSDYVCLKLEPGRYAVFVHTHHVSTLPQAIDTIWTRWAPDCGLKIAGDAPCVEHYTPEFDGNTGMGRMEIWVPLKPE